MPGLGPISRAPSEFRECVISISKTVTSTGGRASMKLNFPHNAANRIWGWMLAIDIAIMPGLFFYKLFFHDPQIGYIHLLATYRFGFAKRALVGTIVSWFADRVALWYVYAIGIVAWAVTLTLFIATFRKIYGLTEKNLALFVFVIGSPFFFKNFMYSIEYFDIYGCLVALIALLLPVSGIYPLAMAGACVGLILMHHLQFLLYIPTIGFIVLVRYGLLSGVSVGKVVYGLMLVLALSVVFVAAAYFGNMPIPHDAFLAYVTARASDTLDPSGTNIWYSTIQQEVRATWGIMWTNSMRFPIYAALIA